jgi:hypothetical protein
VPCGGGRNTPLSRSPVEGAQAGGGHDGLEIAGLSRAAAAWIPAVGEIHTRLARRAEALDAQPLAVLDPPRLALAIAGGGERIAAGRAVKMGSWTKCPTPLFPAASPAAPFTPAT